MPSRSEDLDTGTIPTPCSIPAWKGRPDLKVLSHAPAGDRLATPGPIEGIRTALNRALRGKVEVVEHVLACSARAVHMLIEDLPGLGKTTLAKALAHALGGKFSRIQCTPDLLPGDITGFRVFDQNTREFEFLPGPVLPMCSWPTRSIAPRRAPKAPCWKRWQIARSRWITSVMSFATRSS